MKTQKFFTCLAILYFIVMSAFVVLIWTTGLFWEIIEIFVDDIYSNFWSRFHDIIDYSYFIILFLNVFIKTFFIYHKGLSLKSKDEN